MRLIEDRLQRLSTEGAAVARAVAILGPDANAARARALTGLARADAAEEELRRERLVEDYAFVHPLVGEAARASIAAAQAADLHARAATLLDDESRIAEHLMHAAPSGSPSVVATLRRAAAAARAVGAPDAAARLLARAFAEPPADDASDAVAFELGRARLEATGDEAPLAHIAPRHTDAARHLARHYALSGRPADAVTVLRRAPAPDEETRLELLAEATIAAAAIAGREAASPAPAASPDLAAPPDPAAPSAPPDPAAPSAPPDPAAPSAPPGLAAPSAPPDPAAPSAPPPRSALRAAAATTPRFPPRTPAERLLFIASRIASGETPDDPVDTARRLLALRLHRDFPASYAVGELTFSAATLLLNGDALDDAERAMDTLRDDATAAGQPTTLAGTHWQQTQIAFQRGDLARCETEARAAVEIGGDVLRPLADPWRALVLVEQGQLDAAEALIPEPIGASGLLNAALGVRGRSRLARGDLPRAIEDLAEARDRSAAYYALRVEPPWQPLLVEVLVLAGREADAAAEIEAFVPAVAHWDTPRAHGHLARLRALLAPRDQAIALLEQAVEQFAAAPLERARALVELGARQGAAGERRTARATLREAFDAAHACGATALEQRARDELRLVGGRPRTPAGGELTPAERRVADLAAGGATNREIARRLFLSPKTIEMHLRSVYRKLDIAGREGLGPGSGTG